MKKRNTALILCVVGGPFGIHKFYEEDILMGIVYLCTMGLFFFGWIADIIKYIAMKDNEYDTEKVKEEKEERKRLKKDEQFKRMEEIKSQRQERLRSKTCPKCGGKNFHAFVETVEVVSGKTKTRYTTNLNPFRPFTLVNKKEKVVRNPITKQVSKFVCDDCGKIFK
mgnify:CR=1 FL=1